MAILNTYQGKYPEAEAFYQRALSIYEQEKEIDHPGVVLLLLSLTALYIQQGRFATAERFYQRVLDRSKIWEQELGDTHYRVALWLNITADLYTKQGEYIKAETLYLCAINFWDLWEQQLGDKFPDKVETFSGLASLYFRQGKHEQGEKLFEQALSLNLNPASVYKKRAYMFLHIKNRIYSIQDFNTSIELLPEDVEAAWMVIWILFDKQLPKSEVAEQLEKIALLDPKSSEAYICRGVALGLRGKHQEGLVELEHALQLDVVDEDAWFWKGMICTRLGDDTTAIAAIAQALQYGLPPILLTPLFWLEQERPQFYQEFAEPLLKQHGLL